jgi:CRISPR-associated protein Csm3
MKLEKIVELTGQVTCLTGLKIGGTKDAVGIGETDNPIIRHPVTRAPYLPGSSLKGKIRSLLELRYSEDSQRSGRPCGCGDCDVCRMFGCGDVRQGREPGRLIFRDARISDVSLKELGEALPGSFAEVKTEIQMDRKTGKTNQGSLRQQERVPEGTVFDFSFSIRLFEEDNDNMRTRYKERLAEAFDLLEQDYLGGCGTRGYGKVKFTHGDQPFAQYLREQKW